MLEVKHQGFNSFSFWWEPSPWLANSYLVLVLTWSFFSACTKGEIQIKIEIKIEIGGGREREDPVDQTLLSWSHLTIITFLEALSLYSATTLGLGASTHAFWEVHKHLVYNINTQIIPNYKLWHMPRRKKIEALFRAYSLELFLYLYPPKIQISKARRLKLRMVVYFIFIFGNLSLFYSYLLQCPHNNFWLPSRE